MAPTESGPIAETFLVKFGSRHSCITAAVICVTILFFMLIGFLHQNSMLAVRYFGPVV